MTDLTIGIVNYNTRHFLEDCLESIYRNPPACTFDIVVVDNGSNDGTIDWLRASYPQVCLVVNDKNMGIARGNNQAIQVGQGRYVLLLNSDTVVSPGTLDRMVEFLDVHPQAGAVGGKLINPDGSFQSSYDDYPTLWSEFLIITRVGILFSPHFPSHRDCHEVREVDWISSACLAVRREAVEQVGLIDERYFIYGDETDLQYRLRKAGRKVYFVPDIVTVHYGGRSLDRWKRRKLVYRGKLLYFQKNYGKLPFWTLRIMYVATSCLKLGIWILGMLNPRWWKRAGAEVRSNLDVLRLCFRPSSTW
jgi:N-acetylglucosaminyl-diphospho-decaprenol L-rhamnosyltransferase